ncbi:MAG TPA: imelysin family protein, partial [Gammaproteobacteria bacterium]|nr:imelysin family protein [Gammaproteobacteria bacterium]
VDQELVEQAYTDPAAFAGEAVNVRGLDALEYLLFYDGVENACEPARSINGDGSWLAIDEAELNTRRAAYAATVAADVKTHADALVSAWADFESNLGTAGNGSEVYPSTHEALNAVSDAAFYVESEVKDMKLGEPAGLVNCVEAVCPAQREFRWTPHNFDAIAANLDGFERLFTGGDGLGFDDLLADAGQQGLATQIEGFIDEAQVKADVDVDMAVALEEDATPVRESHAAVKALTDVLKTQFISVLDLELPDRAEGDND